jgi:hypothetical protein
MPGVFKIGAKKENKSYLLFVIVKNKGKGINYGLF